LEAVMQPERIDTCGFADPKSPVAEEGGQL